LIGSVAIIQFSLLLLEKLLFQRHPSGIVQFAILMLYQLPLLPVIHCQDSSVGAGPLLFRGLNIMPQAVIGIIDGSMFMLARSSDMALGYVINSVFSHMLCLSSSAVIELIISHACGKR
jgi:hypothetical protein